MAGKKKKRPKPPAPKKRAKRRSAMPHLIVARGTPVHGKGWLWAGRLGSQHIGNVLARSKSKALRQLRTMAGKLIRSGRA